MKLPHRFAAILLALSLMASPAAAQLGDVAASPDIAVDLSGAPVLDRQVAIDDLMGSILIESFGGLVDGSDVDAYHDEGAGVVLFSTDIIVSLAGGVVARPEDVVRLDGGVYTIEFDGSAEGVPGGANLDAVTRLSGGDLALSFDVTVDLGGGLTAADEDLVQFDGANFSLLFDTSTAGIDAALDVDGLHEISADRFGVSLDGSGAAGGVNFDDEDLIDLDTSGGTVDGLLFDASAEHAGWAPADLDAVFLPEPGVAAGLALGGALLVALVRRRRA